MTTCLPKKQEASKKMPEIKKKGTGKKEDMLFVMTEQKIRKRKKEIKNRKRSRQMTKQRSLWLTSS